MSEFVMVKRELLEYAIATVTASWGPGNLTDALRAVLAQEAGHVEEPHGMVEPVAYSYKEYVRATVLGAYVWRDKIETERPNTEDSEIKDLVSLYTLVPVPALVLPEPHGKQSNLKDTQYAMGWNACIDKVKELNK